MKRLSPIFLLLTAMASCTQPNKQPSGQSAPLPDSGLSLPMQDKAKTIEAYYRIEGDSVLLPPFAIELKLSPKAEATLKAGHETVMVSVDLEGTPKDTTLQFYRQWGYVVVGNYQTELGIDRLVTFSKIRISKAAYDSLANKDISVLIDVFSGRHSTENNLLDREFLQEPISKMRRQTNILSGKLIGE